MQREEPLCGGTKSGREFLASNPHLAASFLISTNPGVKDIKLIGLTYQIGITPTPPEPSSRRELRAVVQEQLNAKYCKFDYHRLNDSCIL